MGTPSSLSNTFKSIALRMAKTPRVLAILSAIGLKRKQVLWPSMDDIAY